MCFIPKSVIYTIIYEFVALFFNLTTHLGIMNRRRVFINLIRKILIVNLLPCGSPALDFAVLQKYNKVGTFENVSKYFMRFDFYHLQKLQLNVTNLKFNLLFFEYSLC